MNNESLATALAADLAAEIIDARRALAAAHNGGKAEWEAVLAIPELWSVRHETNGFHSVFNMDNEELAQSIVEDLLMVHVEKERGSAGFYPKSQIFRHLQMKELDIRQKRRIETKLNNALSNVIELGLIKGNSMDGYELVAERKNDAEEYCGVIYEIDGFTDMVDDVMAVGGEELLADTLGDLFHKLEDEIDSPRPR